MQEQVEAKDNLLKEGDYVKDILTGEIGVIKEGVSYSGLYPLNVIVVGKVVNYVTREGLENTYHKYPRFVKCEKPKKLVTKEVVTIVIRNKLTGEITTHAYTTAVCFSRHIEIIDQFTNTYEVEE